jgi:hypothetical protein
MQHKGVIGFVVLFVSAIVIALLCTFAKRKTTSYINIYRKIMQYFLMSILRASVVAIMLGGCSTIDSQESMDVWLPPELTEMFAIGEGSYWVMAGNSFGTPYQDSLYVTKTVHDTVDILHPGNDIPIGRKERIAIHYTSIWYGTDYVLRSEALDYCNDGNFNEPCHFMILESYFEGKISGRERFFFFPANVGDAFTIAQNGLAGAELRLDSLHSSFTIRDHTFNNVYQMHSERDFINQKPETIRYVAPGIGIIRWVTASIDWEVLRYRIEP